MGGQVLRLTLSLLDVSDIGKYRHVERFFRRIADNPVECQPLGKHYAVMALVEDLALPVARLLHHFPYHLTATRAVMVRRCIVLTIEQRQCRVTNDFV